MPSCSFKKRNAMSLNVALHGSRFTPPPRGFHHKLSTFICQRAWLRVWHQRLCPYSQPCSTV